MDVFPRFRCFALLLLIAILSVYFPAFSSAQRILPRPVRFINQCLGNIECPADQYCEQDPLRTSGDPDCASGYVPCDSKPNRCVGLLGPNQVCRIGNRACANGLYCAFDSTGATSDPKCAPKIQRGAQCRLDATFPCADDLVCTRTEKRCGPFTRGLERDNCTFDRHCNQEKGFYCKFVQFPQGPQDFEGTCTKKLAQGQPCDRAAHNFECEGFCLRLFAGDENQSFCMNQRKLGQVCTEDTQCRRVILLRESWDIPLCNVQSRPGFKQGICVLESKLIRKPGQPCNLKKDRCDARRNLRCGRRLGKNVCVQISTLNGPCTRGSPFSFCSAQAAGFPLECRRLLALTKKTPYAADVCARVREIVRLGEICNLAEYAVCEKGTMCVAAPGIANRGGRFPDPPLAYCMKTVPAGGDCMDKFTTTCVKGSSCINNKCVQSNKAPKVRITLSGFSVDCSTRPCAPGLICKTEFGAKSCKLPTLVVGPWKKCSSRPTKTIVCRKGTMCTRGGGLKRCRPVGGVGAPCQSNDACRGALKCRPSDENDFFSRRTCYDPTRTAPVGVRCNPRRPACAIGTQEFQRAVCLPKGKSFACQVEATLFGYCSPKANIGCSRGLACSTKSVCMPK